MKKDKETDEESKKRGVSMERGKVGTKKEVQTAYTTWSKYNFNKHNMEWSTVFYIKRNLINKIKWTSTIEKWKIIHSYQETCIKINKFVDELKCPNDKIYSDSVIKNIYSSIIVGSAEFV